MIINKNYKFIDLFAGCGGLSLGLEQAGFEPVLFSELNPSAAETYQINRSEIDYIADVYDISKDDVEKYGDIDLVCGGPPCQGYSAIGIRRTHKADKKDMARNQLYKEMIRVINLAQPKLFLFENVRGLLTGKWSPDGNKGEIFNDVYNAFKSNFDFNYHIDHKLIKSSKYGVPQNRPRVFILGMQKSLNINKSDLFPLVNNDIAPPHPEEALSDLVDSSYPNNGLVTAKYPNSAKNSFQKDMRSKKDSKSYFKRGDLLTEHEYSKHYPETIKKFKYMLNNNGEIPSQYKTKKFAQRVLPKEWNGKGPSITVTSLPDDYIHYSQPRILTVREWARLQTFPDWYQFAGQRTTGGHRRSGTPNSTADQIDIPKYTQIGNAVPVKLAYEIGKHFRSLLK